MPRRLIRFDSTPNPDAVKCVLDGFITDRRRSFRSADSARRDALASALFELQGVTGVLMIDNWITVNKSPDMSWKRLKPRLRRTLEAPGGSS